MRQFGELLQHKGNFLNVNLPKLISGENSLTNLCTERKIHRAGINLMVSKIINGDYRFCKICNNFYKHKNVQSIEVGLLSNENYILSSNYPNDESKICIECIKKIGTNLVDKSKVTKFDFFQFDEPHLLIQFVVNNFGRKSFFFNGKISQATLFAFYNIHNKFSFDKKKQFILDFLGKYGYKTNQEFQNTNEFILFKYQRIKTLNVD